MTPIDPFTEEHLYRIESLDYSKDEILNALAKLCGIRLETVNPERQVWWATPLDAPTQKFSSRDELVMFVKGYAYAYRGARNRMLGLPTMVHKHLAELIAGMDLDLTKRGGRR